MIPRFNNSRGHVGFHMTWRGWSAGSLSTSSSISPSPCSASWGRNSSTQQHASEVTAMLKDSKISSLNRQIYRLIDILKER